MALFLLWQQIQNRRFHFTNRIWDTHIQNHRPRAAGASVHTASAPQGPAADLRVFTLYRQRQLYRRDHSDVHLPQASSIGGDAAVAAVYDRIPAADDGDHHCPRLSGLKPGVLGACRGGGDIIHRH